MSRIGKKPIAIPPGVTLTIDGQTVSVKGPKGQLAWTVVDEIVLKHENGELTLSPRDDSTRAKAMWGLSRSLLGNMVHGVSQGYEEVLELVGVGYRAAMKGSALSMQLGFSHDVDIRRRPASASRCPSRPRSASPASTSSRSARWPPRFAGSVRPSPTRARACAIPAKRSAVRKARRSSHGAHSSRYIQAPGHAYAHPAQGPVERPPASVGVPFVEEHLRPGHRRRRRRHAGGRLLVGKRQGCEGADKDAAARVGKLVAERAIEKGVKDVVFDRGGYIITAGSKPWPTPRAKPA